MCVEVRMICFLIIFWLVNFVALNRVGQLTPLSCWFMEFGEFNSPNFSSTTLAVAYSGAFSFFLWSFFLRSDIRRVEEKNETCFVVLHVMYLCELMSLQWAPLES